MNTVRRHLKSLVALSILVGIVSPLCANTAIYVDAATGAVGTSTSKRRDQAYVNHRASQNCLRSGGSNPMSVYQGTSRMWFAVARDSDMKIVAIHRHPNANRAAAYALSKARQMGAKKANVIKLFKGL